MKSSIRTAIAAVALLAAAATQSGAQSIADRVAHVADGRVRISFAARPDICGSGNSIYHGRNGGRTTWGNRSDTSRDVEWEYDCSYGPVRVVLDRRGGETTALRYYVGGRWRPAGSDVADLGIVPAQQAADYLMSVAQMDRGNIGSKAIFPATLADSAVIWPSLIRLARTPQVPVSTRKQAVFWIGVAAGEAAAAELGSIVSDNSVDREIREQAVFALSQRPRSEGIPALINVARTNRDPEIRKKAIFWLGQSNDPRALDLFEELLTRR